MIEESCPVRIWLRSRSFAKSTNRPATFPAVMTCFDIFSPLPGDIDVISHFERLSSIETKIASRSMRMAVGLLARAVICMGRLRIEWR
jgi:hypothetical protein